MVLENFRLFESTIAPTDIENNQESLALIKTQNAILSKIAKIDKKEGVKPTKFPALKSNEVQHYYNRYAWLSGSNIRCERLHEYPLWQ